MWVHVTGSRIVFKSDNLSKCAINIYSHKYRDIECLSSTQKEEESIEYTQHNGLSLGLFKIRIQLDLAWWKK